MRRPALLAVLVLPLANCAGQPCNPHTDNNFFQVLGCTASPSGYQGRVDAMEGNLAGERARAGRAGEAAAGAQQDYAYWAGQREMLRQELAAEQQRAAALQRRLATARQQGQADRQSLAQRQGELDRLRREQQALTGQQPSAALRQRVDALRQDRERLEARLRDANVLLEGLE